MRTVSRAGLPVTAGLEFVAVRLLQRRVVLLAHTHAVAVDRLDLREVEQRIRQPRKSDLVQFENLQRLQTGEGVVR